MSDSAIQSATGDTAGTGVTVRPILREDVTAVFQLLTELARYEKMLDILTGTPAMLEDALFATRGPRLEGLVAERSGTLVGYALFYPVFGSFRTRWRMWLEDLFVAPIERGSGAGRLLMAELARIAESRNWYAVDWEVLDWNEPALGFYQHLGATRIASDWYRYRLSGDALKALAVSPR
jgi:GNAT superfamily N-acetyltransferase